MEPFQDSTSAPVASCGPFQVPTAAQKLLPTQEIPDSSSPLPTLGLGVVDHCVPFQVSTKVPDSCPTAAQKAALEHETPSKDALLLRFGEEAIAQNSPFHMRIKGSPGPDSALWW